MPKEEYLDSQAHADWRFVGDAKLPEDQLLACLMLFTQYHHNATSAEALLAGLPLENNRLSVELLPRAALRADLEATVKVIELADITQLILPAIVPLADNKAMILLKIEAESHVIVINPGEDHALQKMSHTDFAKLYRGEIIFLKPSHRFSQRAKEHVDQTQRKHWFWPVITKSWPIYSEVLIASFLINLFALAVPLFIMNVYDRVVPNQAIETMWVLAIGVGIVFIFDFVMKTLRAYFVDMAGKNIDVKMSATIFEQIMGMKMSARPKSVGAFVNTVQSFESFRDFITSTTITVLIDLPFVLLYIGIIALIGGSLALVPMILLPLVIFIGYILQVPLVELTKQSYQHAAEKQATLIESLSGAEAIKSIRGEGTMQRRWENVLKLASRLGIKLRLVSNASINIAVLAQQIGTVAIVLLGVYKISDGDLTTGALIACTIIGGRALAPMSQIASLLTRYHQSINSLEAVDNVMQQPVERPSEKHFLHRETLKGEIEFKNVSFHYPNEPVTALHNISFKIKPGEKVGIIGRIGSGKTTIIKLINGLYEPSEGSILIDGTDIHQIDPADLRHAMGYVPQDVMLFYGSVRENITMGAPYASDDAILDAAAVSGVSMLTSKHPQGFDLQVGERGSNLSGGQRQMISIARSLLLKPNILLMDEPSTSMDDGSEAYLRQKLSDYLVDKTMLLVTHKHTMLNLVDRIILVDDGVIVADGPKEAVIKALHEGKIKSPK